MTSPREESSVPEPTSSADSIEHVADITDLPPADAADQAADVRGGVFSSVSNVLKTRHDTAKNSISNVR